MTEIFPVIIAACLVSNFVLEHLLGVDQVFAVSRTIETALGMALAILVVMPATTLSCFLVFQYLLSPLGLGYLQLPVFTMLILLTCILLRKVLQKFKPALHEKIAIFFPILLVNSALLGAALLAMKQDGGVLEILVFSLASAFGFGAILVIFSALRNNISAADVPTAFEGPAVLLITLGILSMSFMGFIGLSE